METTVTAMLKTQIANANPFAEAVDMVPSTSAFDGNLAILALQDARRFAQRYVIRLSGNDGFRRSTVINERANCRDVVATALDVRQLVGLEGRRMVAPAESSGPGLRGAMEILEAWKADGIVVVIPVPPPLQGFMDFTGARMPGLAWPGYHPATFQA